MANNGEAELDEDAREREDERDKDKEETVDKREDGTNEAAETFTESEVDDDDLNGAPPSPSPSLDASTPVHSQA